MLTDAQIKKIISRELIFKTSRSSGKGGQNVNKVETKVEIHFNIQDSEILTDAQKIQINKKYKSAFNSTPRQKNKVGITTWGSSEWTTAMWACLYGTCRSNCGAGPNSRGCFHDPIWDWDTTLADYCIGYRS